jgi:hypothetical protein
MSCVLVLLGAIDVVVVVVRVVPWGASTPLFIYRG